MPRILITALMATLLAVGLAACATPTASVVQNADYGAFPDNYKDAVRVYLQAVLKDPESARIRYLSGPSKAYMRAAPIKGGKPEVFGYLVVVGVNAKNSFGGYTGEQQMRLLIRDGAVQGVIQPNPYFKEPWYQ